MNQAGRVRAGLAAAILVILAGMLAAAVSAGLLSTHDEAVRQWFAAIRSDRGLAVMVAVSRVSSEHVTPFVVILLGLLIGRRDRAWAKYLVVLVATSVLWHVSLKPLLAIPRPQPALLPYWAGFGFPSGHALSNLCLALGLAWWIRCRSVMPARTQVAAIALTIGWAVLVAASRLYVDAHWLSDVVAGLLLGTAHFLGSLNIFRPKLERISAQPVTPAG